MIVLRYDARNESMIKPLKPSLAKAILTDPQFWIPVAVLVLGVGLLMLVDRI
jgi:hypothetical protein